MNNKLSTRINNLCLDNNCNSIQDLYTKMY